MAHEVDICNLALGHLKDETPISGINPPAPSGSVAAVHCQIFYPMARDVLLEDYAWGFAKRRSSLGTGGTPPPEWQYQYKVPNLYLRALKVYTDGSSTPAKFDEESNDAGELLIVTDAADAMCLYIYREINPVRFSAKFVEALSFRLAAYLAGPLSKGEKVRQQMWKEATLALPEARVKAANTRKTSRSDVDPKDYTPAAIRKR